MRGTQRKRPQWPITFLHWFCREELVEEITGDLYELFEEEVEALGARRAKWKYYLRAFGFFKPSNLKYSKPNNNMMLFKNYLLIATRNLIKYKGYTVLNLVGMILGLLASIYMITYVLDELSYDQQFSDYEKIYRVADYVKLPQSEMHAAITPGPLGDRLKAEIPEIADHAAFSFFSNMTFQVDGQRFSNEHAYYVSKSFLKLFDYPLITGDPESVFESPKSVLLSKTAALRYFGTLDIMGKTLEDVHAGSLKITGIMQDPPSNMHFRPEILYNLGDERFFDDNWADHTYYTFIKLKQTDDLEKVTQKLPDFYEKNLKDPIQKTFGGTGHIFLQNIADIHLHSDMTFEVSANSSFENVLAMAFLTFFIVVVVCINYTNMTTAQATKRVKEVGVRKVMGSNQQMIISQFMVESTLLSFLAALIALLLIPVFLPYFNHLTDKSYTLKHLMQWKIIGGYFLIVALAGFLGALYPAFFVSRFKADEVLRKTYSFGKFKLPVNKVLNALQFSVALVMVILTATVYSQLNFVKDQSLGFNQENVFKVALNHRPGQERADAIRQALLTNPNISNVTIVKQTPGEKILSDGLYFEAADGNLTSLKSEFNGVDEHYIDILKINLLAGRNFTNNASDIMGKTVLVNRTLTESLGYSTPEAALGKKVRLPLGPDHYGKIIGVTEDFHIQSFHNKILPHLMVHFVPMNSSLLIKVQGEDLWETHDFINEQIAALTNSDTHVVSLLDQAYWQQYQAEERRSDILTLFSSLIIALSFAGLIGLISFQVRYKAKEVNIRKVFGAAFGNILTIYLRQFSWQIVLSILLAIPLSIYLLEGWLSGFAYRIEIPYALLLIATAALALTIVVVIALKVRVSFAANPSKYLKEE